MKLLIIILFIIQHSLAAQDFKVTSPGNKITLSFTMNKGKPFYSLDYSGREIILDSDLGFIFLDGSTFRENLEIESSGQSGKDTTWTQAWGEERSVRNNYNELIVRLKESRPEARRLNITFRVFDDGLGFRYDFPEQEHLQYFIIKEELTGFYLTGDHKTFWIPGDYDSQEYTYSTTRLSEVDASKGKDFVEIGAKSLIKPSVVQTPLMMITDDGIYINIHEASLLNYPVMHLDVNSKGRSKLTAHLTPDALGNKAYLQTPAVTPWRTIIISDKAEDILASRMIINLNEPTTIEDLSWIRPQKYVGIWWEMHIGTAAWSYSGINNIKLGKVDWNKVEPHGFHGATTERTKRYIDFASEHGFEGVLVEGWNVGWEDWYGNWKEEVFDFVTPYPDFDVKEIHRYASSKGVRMIMHHETSSSVTNYERRLDEALLFMKNNGYDAVKTGYVGRIIPRGEHHDGQWMVNHFTRVAEKAAGMEIMVNSHESVRPTGLHRTYPNWFASEAARGNEFNAWSSGNPPEHETILPFTRLMGGPMDYTPGIFQIKLNYYDENKKEQVHTTIAKQLALYVTLYSPLQMAADLPENYERFPDAFQFIKDVPVDWEETRILAAEPGDYIIIARKQRGGANWFIGAITDEEERRFTIPFDFLDDDEVYSAEIYEDAEDAHWDKNPMAYRISRKMVTNKESIIIQMKPGGGTAISLKLVR
jgi:glucan 1,4-alpha-glucosidase